MIIIAVLLIIPIQFFIPFPYGLGAVLFLLILGIVSVIVSRRNHQRREKFAEENVKYEYGEDKPKENKKDEKSWDGI